MKIALLGNPNCGKSSLFNHLTGLRQKIGNFPGVTVDKKIGTAKLPNGSSVEILDLPGTYSIYPNSQDEQVVLSVLTNPADKDFPDLVVVVVDASNLKRNLLLFSQVVDLGFPVILALNMLDVANEHGIEIHSLKLASELQVPVVEINAREGIGLTGLKNTIATFAEEQTKRQPFLFLSEKWEEGVHEISLSSTFKTPYAALLHLVQADKMLYLSPQLREKYSEIAKKTGVNATEFQSTETLQRFSHFDTILEKTLLKPAHHEKPITFSEKLDKVLLHKIYGYVIFLGILFLIFQSVFTLASYPMDWIDLTMSSFTNWVREVLPPSLLVDLLVDGVLAGIGGVLIFIPQIGFLFAFISILEESGYMSRVVVLMDKLIRPFGLNGKSVVPLISGLACAVPAIMSARTIGSWKDRLITIMVTPLMSCSARLPIFTILIAMVIPDTKWLGLFNWQGIALLGLYLLGFLSALLVGWVMKHLLHVKEKSFFVMELPVYQSPRWTQVGFTILEKVKTFVWEAGKVIVSISIILWVLATYGPGDRQNQAEAAVLQASEGLTETEIGNRVASARLANSYVGIFGKAIEPAIAPLGYDWKIGIALITSFAAREVFVGTVATIYKIGSDDTDESTIKERLLAETHDETGLPVYTLATSASLMIFYVFAMMCMSTIAVVYRETKGWKWPLIQMGYMMALAYSLAWITYLVFS